MSHHPDFTTAAPFYFVSLYSLSTSSLSCPLVPGQLSQTNIWSVSYSEPCNSNPTTYKIKFSSLLYHTPGTPQPICDTKFSQELCSLHSLLNKICFCLKLHSCSSAQMKTLHLLKGTTPAIFLLSPASFVSFPLEHD